MSIERLLGAALVSSSLLSAFPSQAAEEVDGGGPPLLDLQLRLGPAFGFTPERDNVRTGVSAGGAVMLRPVRAVGFGVYYDYVRFGWTWTQVDDVVLDDSSYIEQHAYGVGVRLSPLKLDRIEPYADLKLGRLTQNAGHSGEHCSDPSPALAFHAGAGLDYRATNWLRVGGGVEGLVAHNSSMVCNAVLDPTERRAPQMPQYLAARVGATFALF